MFQKKECFGNQCSWYASDESQMINQEQPWSTKIYQDPIRSIKINPHITLISYLSEDLGLLLANFFYVSKVVEPCPSSKEEGLLTFNNREKSWLLIMLIEFMWSRIMAHNACHLAPSLPLPPTRPYIAHNDLLDLLQFSPLHKTHSKKGQGPGGDKGN